MNYLSQQHQNKSFKSNKNFQLLLKKLLKKYNIINMKLNKKNNKLTNSHLYNNNNFNVKDNNCINQKIINIKYLPINNNQILTF
jgi:hypothetical protein